jgi:hypothetical protein
VPAEATISGFVAIVVQPDAVTIRAAYEHAAASMPQAAEQTLAPGALPHITLTQCPVRDAPRARMVGYVTRLDAALRGTRIPLRTVIPFGGGFLFWCVEETSPARALLQLAHEDALTLGDGVLDPIVNARVVEGTKKGTNDDPVLVGHAQRYGYAFVRDRYLPHITLGFDPRVRAGSPSPLEPRAHVMRAERVVLARMGALGRVEHVLTL